MMRAFKTFWKEYAEICKMSGKWCKKHWKGYIVLTAAIVGAEYTWWFREDIKDKIEERKSKKEEGVQ